MISTFDFPTQSSGWPIVGHERAVAMLRKSLRGDSLAHAYLFTGSEGVGKRTLAVTFAMALNCGGEAPVGQPWPDVPCGLCPSCSRTLHSSHPDVAEINLQVQAQNDSAGKGKAATAKELKIDIIREMQASVGLRPHSGRWRVYIVGDADRLNEEASNAMLKTLEEPPSHTILILLANDEESVLPTISSRCLLVPLRPLARTAVANALVEVWGAERENAETLAALSGGRPGYAASLLADRESMGRRKAALEEAAVLWGAPITERINRATKYAKMFTDARPDLYAMLDVWEGWWRDVLVVGASAEELAANLDQLPTLQSGATRATPGRAAVALHLIGQTRKQLQENVNPRLALEALTLGLP